ncbi:MAG: Asp-tRNA(Asn)/Glu-tRNA(Gln) amidotransferase subunit GatB [Patescibacteria group bacterium]|nr:Asp-tRNA(Asn)/Glu-tRNA(Gln) amidotransferase subunit GatB [Patescibacteria group bacterium]
MDKKYQPIIGMEVHVELKTASKMFCGCKNDPFGAPKPNIYTCPVCLGLPGALPVANKKAIEWTISLGLALGCKINLFSKFDRKHYFYPDLAKGYQISQYDLPFCYDGEINTSFGKIRIRRIHLEEDTGKLIHSTINNKKMTLIDFNRSGVPLIEIVTEPDIKSASQAKEYAKKLFQIIRYLDISEADMEKGQMRLEANISLQIQNSKTKNQNNQLPNYKVELKNINSFRFLEKAIEAEIKRQEEIINEGKTPTQETRGYNAEKNITYSQRAKEDASDYRYFPDPDIPPIKISESWFESIKKNMPENYDYLLSRWEKEYGAQKSTLSLLFETNTQSKWLDGLFSYFKKQNLDTKKLINFLVNKKIKVNLFVDNYQKIISVFNQSISTSQIDEEEIDKAISQAIKENPQAVLDFKSGKKNAINFLLGQTMKILGKKTDTKIIIEKISKKIF